MTIGIDLVGTNLGSGTKTYNINFCNELNSLKFSSNIKIFICRNYLSQITKKKNKRIKYLIKPNFLSISFFRLLWMQLILPFELKFLGIKKLYSPMNFSPILSKFLNIKSILCLHSNLPWVYFNLMPGNLLRNFITKKLMEMSIYSCDLLIVNSNFAKKEIVDEGVEKFGKDFITQDWSDRQKEKAEKREAKGKGEPQLYNYVMRQTEVLSDGSIVGSLEQYYVVVHTYTDPKTGATRTTYTYYYNDIIAFKVAADGGFEWLTKINKTQISSNDGGYLSSYLRFLDNGKMCFVFNDNVNNYDEAGKFLKPERISSASFSKKRNVVAIVEVDLADGDYDRRSFFDRKEIASILVPKQCQIDYTNKEILLYSISGRKERYGLMPFKE